MFEATDWQIDGTALKSEDKYSEAQAEKLCSILNIPKDSTHFDNGIFRVFASDVKNIFFLEESYIRENSSFRQVLGRFSEKEFNENFCYFSHKNSSLSRIDTIYKFEDLEYYKKLVSNNIIVNDGIRQENLYLSPYIFDTILKFIKKYESESYYEDYNDMLIYMRELFSLFAISEKTIYRNISDNQSFVFQFFHESYGVIEKIVYWQDWQELSSSNFFSLYKWLIENIDSTSDQDNNNRNLTLVKNIVQNYIRNKHRIEVNNDPTNELNSILGRIRTGQTETYFEQQNKLKDEMIMLNQNEMESKNRIHSRLLGVLTTVSIGYYSQFLIDYDGIENIESLSEPNLTLAVIFSLSGIAVLFFMFSFFIEIFERRNYYDEIEQIYVDYLFFDKKDFNSKLKKPHYWKDYWIYWLILGSFLLISILLTCYYFP